jgi:hypothetical protein
MEELNMAHKLDGDWHLFIIFDQSGTPVITQDGRFHLKHSASNDLENTSVHIDQSGNSHNLTGSSKPDGSGGYDIEIWEFLAATGKSRRYLGNVIPTEAVGGKDITVIGGAKEKPVIKLKSVRSKGFQAPIPGQTDGVWVGTQP